MVDAAQEGPAQASAAEPREQLAAFAAESLDWHEVLDVFAQYAYSSLGRRMLRDLVPRSDDEARRALARTAEILAHRRVTEGPSMGGLTDPMPALERSRTFGRPLEEGQLSDLLRFLHASVGLRAWMLERAESLPTVALLADGLPDHEVLIARLGEALDGRGNLRDDASPMLARLRADIGDLSRTIDRKVSAIAQQSDLRVSLADGHAGQVHRRAGRPCLAVRAKARGRVRGIVHDHSQSGETVFVEPEAVVEPGNRLAACRVEESREVTRILAELTRIALDREPDIEDTCRRLGELELANLAASYALDFDARPARLPGSPGAAPALLLKAARHPLLALAEREGRLERAVPIDLRLGEDFDLLVVTGPNTGGKTLALKAAGLAALLTRCGLPLPCGEGTTVPLYDGVVADIGDEQEIRQNLSTFSSHLARIRAGLERATPHTLVLLDELGGGTDPAEGAALGEALLETLLERGSPTLASTHIGVLKEFAFRHARVENASAEFDLDSLRPLYHLLVGTPGESRALAIARRLGLPEDLVSRAEARLVKAPDETTELMEALRGSREEAERVRGRTEDRLREVERERDAQDQEREAMTRKGQLLEAEAQRSLEDRLREARPWLERLRAHLGQVPAEPRKVLGAQLDGLETALAGAGLTATRAEFLASLGKGQLVYLPRYRKRCSIVRVDRKRSEVTVRLGNQKLTVPFDDVTTYDVL